MRALLLAAVFAAVLPASDTISGIWVGQIPAPGGQPEDIAFHFEQHGSRLGGKLYGDYQSMRISEGTLAGDLFTFVVVIVEQSGNQIDETRVRFAGRIRGGEIELARDRESSKNAGNGGANQIKNETKRIFRLKRLT